jgi:membrane protease YdiL (CAAX protease family)
MQADLPSSGRRIVRLALFFYAIAVAAALGWGAAGGRPVVLFVRGVSTWRTAGLGAVAGTAFGLAVVGLSRLLVAYLEWARQMFRWFASVLGPLSSGQCLLLAVCSSVGEEMLFRGAMQPTLGLWTTALVFALLHVPSQARLWPWTVMAGLLGLVFGALARETGNLAGPIMSHFVINWLNLMQVSRLRGAADSV